MTKRKPKVEPKPTPPAADITGDHSATLARLTEDAPLVLAHDAKPMHIGSANAVIACPTCGSAKTSNRCDVCGHQEHDT